jgi:hypothetical protein
MVTMPDRTATAKPHEIAGDRLIEMAQKKAAAPPPKPPADELSLAELKKPRSGLLQSLGKLKPLLPILSGGLRMVDHGAVQALAHLLNVASGAGASQMAVQEELHQGLEEIQTSHRELHLQVQDQTVEMQRIKDQITLLRQTIERNDTEHAELVDNVRSLRNLVRFVGAGLAILLVILIALTAVLLTRHHS